MFDINNNQDPNQEAIKSNQPANPSSGSIKKNDAIDISGTKEPEDIFSNIQDPVLTNNESVNPAMAVIQKPSSSIIKKIAFALIIFVVIFGIGIGSWYAYRYFTNNKKTNNDFVLQNQEHKASPQKISQVESAERPSVKLPFSDNKKDELDQKANQLAVNMLQGQKQKIENQATSTVLASSTEKEQPSTTTIKLPKNIPLPATNTQAVAGEDNDQDKLTNFEEKLLGTNPDNKDTDGDGYDDYSELIAGYDPLHAVVKLSKSPSVKFAKIGLLKFMMPNSWQLEAGLNGIVKINTGTLITIIANVSIYSDSYSLQDWILKQNPAWSASDISMINNDLGLESYYSPDKNKAWILSDNTLYEFSYNINTSPTDDFRSLFGLLLKHIKEAQ